MKTWKETIQSFRASIERMFKSFEDMADEADQLEFDSAHVEWNSKEETTVKETRPDGTIVITKTTIRKTRR